MHIYIYIHTYMYVYTHMCTFLGHHSGCVPFFMALPVVFAGNSHLNMLPFHPSFHGGSSNHNSTCQELSPSNRIISRSNSGWKSPNKMFWNHHLVFNRVARWRHFKILSQTAHVCTSLREDPINEKFFIGNFILFSPNQKKPRANDISVTCSKFPFLLGSL